jgi:hypothetical protein
MGFGEGCECCTTTRRSHRPDGCVGNSLSQCYCVRTCTYLPWYGGVRGKPRKYPAKTCRDQRRCQKLHKHWAPLQDTNKLQNSSPSRSVEFIVFVLLHFALLLRVRKLPAEESGRPVDLSVDPNSSNPPNPVPCHITEKKLHVQYSTYIPSFRV